MKRYTEKPASQPWYSKHGTYKGSIWDQPRTPKPGSFKRRIEAPKLEYKPWSFRSKGKSRGTYSWLPDWFGSIKRKTMNKHFGEGISEKIRRRNKTFWPNFLSLYDIYKANEVWRLKGYTAFTNHCEKLRKSKRRR